ncbi:RNA polymerase Rpb6 [bacterium BMS3Abin05]|nr:RNA polymerase Rpb6 [bacterium BMS3Abin05]GBE27324.1 RNA polymerase Rpb6 [bacterium BMS3Bbin03]HDL78368.1 hypothetical protein [Bacteroidota bacterium]HDZ13129.1 hypothetical protein [Bacteroidota bacterium]
MVETLPLDRIKKENNNIYELVVALAKRARQINEERRARLHMEINTSDEYEDLEEALHIHPIESQVYERKIKPTRQAVEEFLQRKLEIRYPKTDM